MEKCSIINNDDIENLDIEGDKMRKITNIIVIALMSLFLIFSMPSYSNATSLDGIIDAGNSFLNIPKEDGMPSVERLDEGGLKTISKTVSGVLLTIAIGVTVISAVVMGINFTIQSVEDKAKIKESMIPWIIGIFVSFGAYGIWNITMKVFYQII